MLEFLQKYKKTVTFILVFSCLISFLMSQQQDYNVENLRDKVAENARQFTYDSDKALKENDELLKEAVKLKDHSNELVLLANRCWHYNRVLDIENLINSSRQLKTKAAEYGSLHFQAVAHAELSEGYIYAELYDKAIAEFELAIGLLERSDPNDYYTIMVKSNTYMRISQAYYQKEEFREMVDILNLAAREIEKIDIPSEKKRFQYFNYANLAQAYTELDMDSAEYFVNRSMELNSGDKENDPVLFRNNITLGHIYRKKKHFAGSIDHYNKAQKHFPESGDLTDLENVYKGLIEIYAATDSIDQAELYGKKLKDIQLEISKNKYKSLHTIIENKMLEDNTKVIYISVGFTVLILLLLMVVAYFKKRNSQLIRQEKISQQYLEEFRQQSSQDSDEKDYTKLIEMLKNNDAAFMTSFLELFPDFMDKLKTVNNKIVPTEVEFCALLKLNLSTKEIARYKNIEPVSVQKKKQRIRKKLNIPSNEDIYFWFNKL